jgi:hypothetical protein
MSVLHCRSKRSKEPHNRSADYTEFMCDSRNLCEIFRFAQDDSKRTNNTLEKLECFNAFQPATSWRSVKPGVRLQIPSTC